VTSREIDDRNKEKEEQSGMYVEMWREKSKMDVKRMRERGKE